MVPRGSAVSPNTGAITIGRVAAVTSYGTSQLHSAPPTVGVQVNSVTAPTVALIVPSILQASVTQSTHSSSPTLQSTMTSSPSIPCSSNLVYSNVIPSSSSSHAPVTRFTCPSSSMSPYTQVVQRTTTTVPHHFITSTNHSDTLSQPSEKGDIKSKNKSYTQNLSSGNTNTKQFVGTLSSPTITSSIVRAAGPLCQDSPAVPTERQLTTSTAALTVARATSDSTDSSISVTVAAV